MNTKISVSKKSIIARINRLLKENYEFLRTSRGSAGRTDLGEHFIVDMSRNIPLETHVDIEDLAKELNVLRPGEFISESA